VVNRKVNYSVISNPTKLTNTTKTYSEQILEPSQVYEFGSISKAHIENMIILFHTVLVYVMHSFRTDGIRLLCVPNLG
jgi:K+-transporting ATPase A subunit